jgi:hypothetical protein
LWKMQHLKDHGQISVGNSSVVGNIHIVPCLVFQEYLMSLPVMFLPVMSLIK